MKFSLTDYFLEFKTPFSIAHGTRSGTDLVFLKLEEENRIAWGEASLPPYLPETKETVRKFITDFLSSTKDFSNLEHLLNLLMHFAPGNFAAKACVDIAFHNLFATRLKTTIAGMLGIHGDYIPDCTFTIGMGTDEELEHKVMEAESFRLLKVKLGGDRDKQIITTIRKLTDKPICVDVNQGWKDKETALEMIGWLNERNVLFVEQPLDKNDYEGQRWLKLKSTLPIIADEAVQIYPDVERIAEIYDGINVKLMKCGGVGEGIKMIRKSRELKLKVLVGSMSESGCGIAAAAQLAPLADWVDLDGPLLTKNNPFDTVEYSNGKVYIKLKS